MVALVSIRVQPAGKALQKVLCMLRFPCGLVLIQDNGLLRTAAGPVQPHIGLAGGGTPRFLQHLQGRFVGVQHRLLTKLLAQRIVDWPQPLLRSVQQPVGHGLPGQLQALALKFLLQPVQWGVHDKFLCHDVSHCLRGGKTAGQQRRFLRRLHNVGFTGLLLTVLAGVGVVHVLTHPELCRLHH